MAELLLELLCEELPLWAQRSGRRELKEQICSRLQELGFLPDAKQARDYATPRRLVLVVQGLQAEIAARQESRRGPRANAPEKAIMGFCRSLGVQRHQLQKQGEYLYAVLETPGESLAAAIARIVPEVITSLAWQKSMRWGEGELLFARPLRSILCLVDGEAVDLSGLPDVQSGNTTRGHRFLSPDVFEVRDFADYEKKLFHAKIVLDSQERRDKIWQASKALTEQQNIRLIENKALLDEAAAMTEWPVPILCAIEKEYMQLPDEVLLQVICGQQKYLAAREKDSERLAPFCIAIADIEAKDGGTAIRKGNERVLRARLSDADFFRKKDLEQWQFTEEGGATGQRLFIEKGLEKLDSVVFYGKITMKDKAKYMEKLVYSALDDQPFNMVYHFAGFRVDEDSENMTGFAKLDLISEMVREFPKLQGFMGGYYARHAGVLEDVATAIGEQYLPKGPDDPIPATPLGRCLSVADKLVTLACLWPDKKARPSGSGDPYGLRRAALGVIRILLEGEIAFPMSQWLERLFKICGSKTPPGSLQEFFVERMKIYLRQRKGLRPDVVDAVLFYSDDLLEIYHRAEALASYFPDTQEGRAVLQGYKRAANILRDEKTALDAPEPQENALQEPTEKKLHQDITDAERDIDAAMSASNYRKAVACCARLRAPIDDFFDHVRVNAEDESLRENRLRLLRQTCRTLEKVADFSKISDK